MMETLIKSYLLAALATIAHALTAWAIIEMVDRVLIGGKQPTKSVWAIPVLILVIWWGAFLLLLGVVR